MKHDMAIKLSLDSPFF